MRNILFVVSLIILFSCQDERQVKAKSIIDKELKGFLYGGDYDFVSMTPLDSAYARFYMTKEAELIQDSIRKFESNIRTLELQDNYYLSKKEKKILSDSIVVLNEKINNLNNRHERLKKEYIPEFCGYKTIFTFDHIGRNGVKSRCVKVFVFDKDITRIIDQWYNNM